MFVFKRAKGNEEKPSAAEIAKHKNELEKILEQHARTTIENNLKNLVLAMAGCHDKERTLPAHAIYDKAGKTPLLSWRVAVLPYLGQEKLHKQFKLDEPWDSDHNKKLIPKMPGVYRGIDPDSKEGMTPFQVFSGPHTPFNGTKRLTLLDFSAGISNAILIVEAKEHVIWTKPTDLTLPKEKDELPPLGGALKSGFLAGMADGFVRHFPDSTPVTQIRAKINPAGKE